MNAYVYSTPEGPEGLIHRHVQATCKVIGPAKYSEEIEACFALMYRLVTELRSQLATAEAMLERGSSPTREP